MSKVLTVEVDGKEYTGKVVEDNWGNKNVEIQSAELANKVQLSPISPFAFNAVVADGWNCYLTMEERVINGKTILGFVTHSGYVYAGGTPLANFGSLTQPEFDKVGKHQLPTVITDIFMEIVDGAPTNLKISFDTLAIESIGRSASIYYPKDGQTAGTDTAVCEGRQQDIVIEDGTEIFMQYLYDNKDKDRIPFTIELGSESTSLADDVYFAKSHKDFETWILHDKLNANAGQVTNLADTDIQSIVGNQHDAYIRLDNGTTKRTLKLTDVSLRGTQEHIAELSVDMPADNSQVTEQDSTFCNIMKRTVDGLVTFKVSVEEVVEPKEPLPIQLWPVYDQGSVNWFENNQHNTKNIPMLDRWGGVKAPSNLDGSMNFVPENYAAQMDIMLNCGIVLDSMSLTLSESKFMPTFKGLVKDNEYKFTVTYIDGSGVEQTFTHQWTAYGHDVEAWSVYDEDIKNFWLGNKGKKVQWRAKLEEIKDGEVVTDELIHAQLKGMYGYEQNGKATYMVMQLEKTAYTSIGRKVGIMARVPGWGKTPEEVTDKIYTLPIRLSSDQPTLDLVATEVGTDGLTLADHIAKLAKAGKMFDFAVCSVQPQKTPALDYLMIVDDDDDDWDYLSAYVEPDRGGRLYAPLDDDTKPNKITRILAMDDEEDGDVMTVDIDTDAMPAKYGDILKTIDDEGNRTIGILKPKSE